jgi:hypothetical protein
MTEEYNDHFKNPQLIEELIKSILQKFYSVNNDDYKNIAPMFDILGSIIKASGELLKGFCNEFINRALNIIDYSIKSYNVKLPLIQKNNKDISCIDKELTTKCIELLCILCDVFPNFSSEVLNQSLIVEYIIILLEVNFIIKIDE